MRRTALDIVLVEGIQVYVPEVLRRMLNAVDNKLPVPLAEPAILKPHVDDLVNPGLDAGSGERRISSYSRLRASRSRCFSASFSAACCWMDSMEPQMVGRKAPPISGSRAANAKLMTVRRSESSPRRWKASVICCSVSSKRSAALRRVTALSRHITPTRRDARASASAASRISWPENREPSDSRQTQRMLTSPPFSSRQAMRARRCSDPAEARAGWWQACAGNPWKC